MASLNENKVALGFVVDRSGSMAEMDTREVCGSLNKVVKDQLDTGKEILTWLYTFDDECDIVHRCVNAKDVKITKAQIEPRGCTALYDAMKKTIKDIGADLRNMNDRPGKVIVVILTDGEENSSKNATRNEVMDMVKEQQEKYSWEFIFLGANQDAIGNGAGLGIGRNTSCTYDYSARGCSAVLRSASSAIQRTITGETPHVEFTEEERNESQCFVRVPVVPNHYVSMDDIDFLGTPTRTNAGSNRVSFAVPDVVVNNEDEDDKDEHNEKETQEVSEYV